MTSLPKRLLAVAALSLGPAAIAASRAAPEAEAPAAPAAVARAARPITGGPADYSEVLAAAAGASRILLGESTHGTHEYYRERGRLTERLIREQGVNAVAVEGDWSPTARVNLYVRGLGTDRSARQALRGFTGFPAWTWANTDFAAFVERLRTLNLERPPGQRVGLYGMDVYDLFEAADAVTSYLRRNAPGSAAAASAHYRCFGRYGRDAWAYGVATRDPRRSCRKAAEAVLASVRAIPRPAAAAEAEAWFGAVRAAASVAAAEDYFRTAAVGSLAWNVRDRHMADNVDSIAAHAEALTGRPGKVVVWSHNSHSGDARSTFAANRGQVTLGQLMRERHGAAAFLVGLFSHSGSVYAAPEWGAPGRRHDLRPAAAESHSGLFHRAGLPAFSLLLRGRPEAARALDAARLQRAIGVVYQPALERTAHYFEARLPGQFDAVAFFDRTRAVTPLAAAGPPVRAGPPFAADSLVFPD